MLLDGALTLEQTIRWCLYVCTIVENSIWQRRWKKNKKIQRQKKTHIKRNMVNICNITTLCEIFTDINGIQGDCHNIAVK